MITQEEFDKILASAGPSGPASSSGMDGANTKFSLAALRELMALLIPNTFDRDVWSDVGHDLKAICENDADGLTVFVEWTEQWVGHGKGSDYVREKWGGFGAGGLWSKGVGVRNLAEKVNPDGYREWLKARALEAFPEDGGEAPDDESEAYQPTHVNMRDMILRRERGWLGWLSNAPQRWASFDGALGRWSIGETDAAMRSAVRKEIEARKQLAIDPKVAKEMGRASWALAVHSLLKHHSMFEIPRHQFNADPDLLGTPAGALRFGPQMQIEAGRPDHMLSKATRFAAGKRQGRPEWDRFMLEFCSGDASLVRWLQTFCGYCLTGHTTEHVMLFLYGPGGNGKSLFLDTIGSVLGDYHHRADHRLFMSKAGNFHLAPLAALEGARLVTCPDVPHNGTWDMGLVKLITGGGSITANYMRENPFSFFPECKLILAGNDKPRLESVDEGVRRRLRLVPCLHMPTTVDRGLTDKLLREGEGILKWMLEGWELWSQFGLPACGVIDTATDDYLNAADVFGRWVKEEITAVSGGEEGGEDKTRVMDLWRSWDAFRAREGSMRSYPNDQGALSTRLKEVGVGEWGRDKHGGYFKGIRLRKVPESVF